MKIYLVINTVDLRNNIIEGAFYYFCLAFADKYLSESSRNALDNPNNSKYIEANNAPNPTAPIINTTVNKTSINYLPIIFPIKAYIIPVIKNPKQAIKVHVPNKRTTNNNKYKILINYLLFNSVSILSNSESSTSI